MSGMSSLAMAQTATDNGTTLDDITVTITDEKQAIDSLAPVSTVRGDQINQIMPTRTSDIFFGMPGVSFQQRADEPATSINIRGLQDFGRVNVLIDGARQNFQRSGHNANGAFYLDPELLAGADVIRGPVANIFGSGAIGGVVSFRTKDVDDILKAGERWGVLASGMGAGGGVNELLTSGIVAVRAGPNVDLLAGATYRTNSDYVAGNNGTEPAGVLAGPGQTIPNTGSNIATGLAKITVRPADGHEVKISGLTYSSNYSTGQIPSSTFDSKAQQSTVTARWRYARPDDNLFDIDANVYWTETINDQTKTCCDSSAITGVLGSKRKFSIDTTGFDANNASRFDLGPIRNTFTFGGDAFHDKVGVDDPTGTGALFTPNGQRDVWGAFAQWNAKYSTWLEVIGAVRYDRYDLSGGGFQSEGDHVSPKVTVGVTPIQGFTVYGLYAEGYRAPAVTEALISGLHPFPASFLFLPNPSLRPEVGKNLEAGINLKYDSIFMKDDTFRAKLNIFRNDVSNYIDLAFVPYIGPGGACPIPPYCFQYQNIAEARLEGVELESMYDAGSWFVGLSGHRIRGRNQTDHTPLLTVPPDQLAATAGLRLLDRKVTLALRWAGVSAKKASEIPEGAIPTGGYDLVDLYLGYQPNENVLAGLSIENLLDKYYFNYLDAQTARIPARGLTVKGSLKVRFSDLTMPRG